MAYRRYGRYRRRRRSYGRRSYGGSRPRIVVMAPNLRTRKRRRVSRKKVAPARKITRFELAQSNPFHPNAYGCKIPDANSVPSCAFQAMSSFLMTTDANGTSARAYRPVTACERIATSSSTATSWTWNSDYTTGITANSKQSSITTNFTVVRPVAHGVRITCPLAPNTVLGSVHICVYSPELFGETGWNSVLPKSFDDMSQQAIYKKIPLAALCSKSVTIINRTIDFSSQRYYDPASTLSANATQLEFQTTGWGIILVAVEAANVSTGVVNVETLTHFEGTPKLGGLSIAGMAAPYSESILTNVTRGVSARDDIVESSVQDENAVSAASGFFRGMQSRASEYLNAAESYMSGRAYDVGRYAVDSAMGAAGMWLGNRANQQLPRIMGAFN